MNGTQPGFCVPEILFVRAFNRRQHKFYLLAAVDINSLKLFEFQVQSRKVSYDKILSC